MTDNISAEQLRLFIERIERLDEEKRGMADDIKDVYAEAKSTGFDAKTMRHIVRLRKMEKHHRDEADALLETYRNALGMGFGTTPLGADIERLEAVTADTSVSMRVGCAQPVLINQKARELAAEGDGYAEAVALVRDNNKASTSWLQRHLRIGYNAAARLIERMEREGIVTKPDHVGRREVLPSAEAA
jgi:uncharacterized protein (UPF0335 family)